ncbi:MAG: LacI family DNA-binding transcriptional regulator [Verrucomicrobia bacterium]|nr:LacI family DNA-binding transcriptional regulator [Verrucomicrobiota bacterium]
MTPNAPTTLITQRDVAQACGLHHSTVCLALKNSPTLSHRTRERIQRVAQSLGYQPNASASNLAGLRKRPGAQGTLPLAWINQEATPHFWREDPGARLMLAAARRRAGELGYHLDEFWAHEPGMTTARLGQILQARGIRGVLFPVYRASKLDLGHAAWAAFACVALNDYRASRWMEVVAPDYYHHTGLALTRAAEWQGLRTGLVLDAEFEAMSDGLVRSCYLRHQEQLNPADRIPPCFLKGSGAEAAQQYAAWQREFQPKAVLTGDLAALPKLNQSRPVLTIALRGSGMPPGEPDAVAEVVAGTAVDLVGQKIQRFENGPGRLPQLHLIRAPQPKPAAAAANLASLAA